MLLSVVLMTFLRLQKEKDAYEIFSIINNDFDSLKDAIHFFKDVITNK